MTILPSVPSAITIHHLRRILEGRSHTYHQITSWALGGRRHGFKPDLHIHCFQRVKMLCTLRILSPFNFFSICIYTKNVILKMHFVVVLVLFLPHQHWSPGNDWRPQLTKQLPLASLCSGCSKPIRQSSPCHYYC